MKLFKNSFFAIAFAIALAGCGSNTAPITASPIKISGALPLKVAQLTDEQLKTWGAADLKQDSIPGMSVEKAYNEIIMNRTGETVIVGVVDSGIDIEHEDLKNVLWVNEDEIPGNGIDDDKNGYVDDIHGWNFLGDVVAENMEFVRYLKILGPKFEGKTESSIGEADRSDFAIYKRAKAEYDKEFGEAMMNKTQYEQILSQVKPAHQAISQKLGKENYTAEDLANIQNPSEDEQMQLAMLGQMLNFASTVPEVIKELEGGIAYFGGRTDSHFNLSKNFREVLGDDPNNLADTKYGNNDVDGPDPKKEDAKHGTHVAGIIAAQRNNGIGINGVANNVDIMVLRAVPDGDEYDKDIALAIRYAVDNGAKVINASFGKYYSPHPGWVYDAIKYAGSKDVLIVKAAGNEAYDLDVTTVYPNDQTDNVTEISDNFLMVGALNYAYGEGMVADFSNYGKSKVDVFAPGVKIWATTPLNTYEYLQGTSMAAPAVAGLAAMIRSYYPKLSAAEVKDIIIKSGLSANIPVIVGGDASKTNTFSNLSSGGKMANLYNALIMADKMSN